MVLESDGYDVFNPFPHRRALLKTFRGRIALGGLLQLLSIGRVATVLQECYKSAVRVLQECEKSAVRVSQKFYEKVRLL
jgi:hypothetical protein